jgi:hypothetical protein
MRVGKVTKAGALLGVVLVGLSCTSPEARRSRGGGPGADVGNRDAVVETHAGSQPYYQTPCRAPAGAC